MTAYSTQQGVNGAHYAERRDLQQAEEEKPRSEASGLESDSRPDENQFLLDGILLSRCQLALPRLGKILHPPVIHDWNGQKALATHATIAGNGIIGGGATGRREQDTSGNGCISRIAVTVGIRIDDDQAIRKLTGHIGVIAASLLGTILHAMAAWIAGQHLHDLIGDWINDCNRGRERVRRDHIFPIGAHRRLNRQAADKSDTADWVWIHSSADRVVVCQEIDGTHHCFRLGVNDRNRAIEQTRHIGFCRVRGHAGCDRQGTGRQYGIDGIIREVVLGAIG